MSESTSSSIDEIPEKNWVNVTTGSIVSFSFEGHGKFKLI